MSKCASEPVIEHIAWSELIGHEYFDIDSEDENDLYGVNELWISSKVQGESVMFCIDSGASRVIMKTEQYLSIPENKRPKLESRNVILKQADGSKLEIDGVARMSLQIGDFKTCIPIYVAPVSDSLLGLNYLRKVNAKIDFDRLQLVINGSRIDCTTRDNKPLYTKVVIECDMIVPGEHEMMVPCTLVNDRIKAKLGLLQPIDQGMLIQSGILVARGVVHSNCVTIPVKVMNTGENERLIKKGTVLAKMFPLQEDEVRIVNTAQVSEQSNICVENNVVPDHLCDLMERCSKGLENEEVTEVVKLLSEYEDVFSKGEFDIGRTSLIKHKIDTPGAHPIRQPLRRSSPEQRAEVDRQVKELLDRNLIQPSDSAWASPIVLVGKKDGSKRLCCDYRKINDVTVKDAYPLPRIDDSLDSLGGAKYFSTLDLAAGYWQVEMDEDAKSKSAFVTTSGLFEWNVLPFGLCNAPSTFERLMDYVLAGLQWDMLLVYLGDVIVFGCTMSESIERLR